MSSSDKINKAWLPFFCFWEVKIKERREMRHRGAEEGLG
jgi:hypothetical protein